MTKSKYFKSINEKLNKINKNKPVFKTGNLKIGYNTIIFNIGSAHNCISAKLGLCQLKDSNKCYAYRAEKQYKTVLTYRNRQLKYWDKVSVHQFIKDIGNIVNKSNIPIKYMRFNEAGEIRNKNDILKIDFIAKWLYSEYGIITYMYTARIDMLPLLKQLKNVVINGSGFMIHNEYKAVDKITNKKNMCIGNCNICNKCKHASNRTVEVLIH
jgi:hypothetical protein